MTYRISRRADADIEAICSHIAKDNPDAAERLDEQIHKAIQMLARFPRMGPLDRMCQISGTSFGSLASM